jgi:RNase H-fold protein (predicted Holliday junction resolvase)
VGFDVGTDEIGVALAAVIATKRQVVQEGIEGSFVVVNQKRRGVVVETSVRNCMCEY